MKRALCLAILLSMVLHCASRLGIISYLYSQRHDIAYTIGIIAEVPIAMCNGEYFVKQAPLAIKDSDNSDRQMPVQFSQAREIVLFVQALDKTLLTEFSVLKLNHNTALLEFIYTPPVISIFHPPCEATLIA